MLKFESMPEGARKTLDTFRLIYLALFVLHSDLRSYSHFFMILLMFTVYNL